MVSEGARRRAWLDVVGLDEFPAGAAPPTPDGIVWECVVEDDEESDERFGAFGPLLDWAMEADVDEIWVWSRRRRIFERYGVDDASWLRETHGVV